jgi:hypothetical protein
MVWCGREQEIFKELIIFGFIKKTTRYGLIMYLFYALPPVFAVPTSLTPPRKILLLALQIWTLFFLDSALENFLPL